MRNRNTFKELNFFYMLAFLGSGLFYGLGLALCKALALGETQTILLTTMFAQFAPAAAAFITMKRFTPPVRMAKSLRMPATGLLCLLVPIIGIGAQAVLLSLMGRPMVASAFFAALPLSLLTLATTLAGSVTEEIGWRGYLQSRLRMQLKPWLSGALTALMWGVWHFTKIFNQGLIAYLLFVLSVLPLGILMSYLTDKARGSLLPSILLHALYNLAFMWFLYERESNIGYLIAFAALSLLVLALRLSDPLYFKQEKGEETIAEG